jgi:hypothetical protein
LSNGGERSTQTKFLLTVYSSIVAFGLQSDCRDVGSGDAGLRASDKPLIWKPFSDFSPIALPSAKRVGRDWARQNAAATASGS